MADIGASNWNEADASNTDAAPDGAPEGMAPSGVNNTLRAHQGAVKRFWDRINPTVTSGGTSAAMTLTYSVTPGALVNGEINTFIAGATNAAGATLNVNALGATPLRLFGGAVLAGAILSGQVVSVRYNSAAGAYDIFPNHGWVRLGEQDPSGASVVDFTSIPAGVNHLNLMLELSGSATMSVGLRTYGADGALDSGASDYSQNLVSSQAGSLAAATTTGSGMNLAANLASGNTGMSSVVHAFNIQRANHTKFTWQTLSQGSVAYTLYQGVGSRAEADRITGLRIYRDTGTITGKATLLASA